MYLLRIRCAERVLSPADRAAIALASHQGGVISLEQAWAAGLSRSSIGRRVDAGEWRRAQPRVYAVAVLRPGRAGDLWAAVLSTGCGVAAGRSAAWWHGMLEKPPVTPEIVVPRALHGRALHGVSVRRSNLDDLDVTVRSGLPVVAKPLAVLQSVAPLGRDGPDLLDRALQQWIRPTELLDSAARFRGRRGARQAGDLVRAAADGAASVAERQALAALRSARIGGWRPNHRVGRFLVDIAFVEARLVIEIDGWAWHHDPERFQADRSRQNTLILAGWRVLRFTWVDLQEPDAVIAQIIGALGGSGGFDPLSG